MGTIKSKFGPPELAARLADLPLPARYVVGFSGGIDSTVLLHALRATARAPVTAVHVNHGLQAQASRWADHCRRICERWNVDFQLVRADAQPGKDVSPEAAARAARYGVLAQALGDDEMLLSAHHQDDQAETLLLQLLRGAGPAGLAAMPRLARLANGWHARPLLDVSRAELEAYARAHELEWIEDTSNQELRFDRNFLRQSVMPLLQQRWPGSSHILAQDSVLQAEACELLADLAAQDLESLRGTNVRTLSVKSLRTLSSARRRNAIRAWIREAGLATPAQAHLRRLESDVLEAREDAEPCVRWPGVEARRYRDELYVMTPLAAHDESQEFVWHTAAPLTIPHLGVTLKHEALVAQGVRCSAGESLTIRFRRGGEVCKPRGERHTRELKKLFQEKGVPPWERNRIPLIYRGDDLLGVLGYWVCEQE